MRKGYVVDLTGITGLSGVHHLESSKIHAYNVCSKDSIIIINNNYFNYVIIIHSYLNSWAHPLIS